MEIGLVKTELAEVFFLKHGPEPLNIEPRNSVCAFRGIHFIEENSFILGFEKREWLIENGCAFLTEPGRIHTYRHDRGAPPDTVLSVRYRTPLLHCMHDELPAVRFSRVSSYLGRRNDLRFLRWRLERLPQASGDLAADEWVVDLIAAAYLNTPRLQAENFPDARLTWYAERIEAAREQLVQRFASRHQLQGLARSVGMSTFQFARIFRELTGWAPHQYLLNVRYRAALHLLLEGASVTTACFQSGFSNLSHFTREFKRRFGYSPSSVKTWPRQFMERWHTPIRLPSLRLRKSQIRLSR